MNNYITGEIIKELRKRKNLTQLEFANIIYVYCNKDGLYKMNIPKSR